MSKQNPLDYERFNKLFHITNELLLLVRYKGDGVGKRKIDGYVEDKQAQIDQLFMDNAKEEREARDEEPER